MKIRNPLVAPTGVTASTPDAGKRSLYPKTDGWYDLDSSGTETKLGGAVPATESTAGVAELATQAETDAGTDDARIVTPAKLQARMAAYAQPQDAALTSIAGLNVAADRILYTTGMDTFSAATITAFARSLINDADAAEARTTLLVPALRRTGNVQTGTSYTLVLTDEDKSVRFTSASPVALTVPDQATASFPSGALIQIIQSGAGPVTVSPAPGVTIESLNGALSTRGQNSVLFLLKRTADTWTLWGDRNEAATETFSGMAEIATQAEVDTGTDDTRIVTPLKLASRLASKPGKFAADCAATTNPQNFDHGLGTDVTFQVWEGNDPVLMNVTKSSTNGGRLTVDFGGAPTAGQYRVVVMG